MINGADEKVCLEFLPSDSISESKKRMKWNTDLIDGRTSGVGEINLT